LCRFDDRENPTANQTFPYVLVKQKGKSFLLTKLPASLLATIAYASRRGLDDEPGAVQRLLNGARIASIKDFTLQVGNYPASIVLNGVSKDTPLTRDKNGVTIPQTERSAQIIDGQHRVAGIKAAIAEDPNLSSLEMPVAIYEGLDSQACADIFLSINTEQKPVPRSLVFDLYGIASAPVVDSAALRARDIAVALNETDESPYYELIKLPGSPRTKGGIALSTVVAAIKPLVEDKGVLEHIGVTELESQKQVILNYLVSLRSLYDKHWFEKSNAFLYGVGFTGAMQFFRDRLVDYCKLRGSFEVKTITDALAPLSKAIILQSEVKGLGGKDAPKKIFERMLKVFEPAKVESASIRI
jgi:DNA sulfur modification protein DndB